MTSIRLTTRVRRTPPESLHPYVETVCVQLRQGRHPLTPSVRREGAMEDQLVALAQEAGLSPSPFLEAWRATLRERQQWAPWWASLWGTGYSPDRQSYTIRVDSRSCLFLEVGPFVTPTPVTVPPCHTVTPPSKHLVRARK